MRLMVLSANSAGAVYSGGFYRVPPPGLTPGLPIGAESGELLVSDATLWADPANIAGYTEHPLDGGRGRRNMPNGLIVNGARFVAGLQLVVKEAGVALPVTLTQLVSNRRVTDYTAQAGSDIHLSGALFTWGLPTSHDTAALYLSIRITHHGPQPRRLWVGIVQPTPDFADLYALRGYLQGSGPASSVQVVPGGFIGVGPVYPQAPTQNDPWVRFQRISLDDAPYHAGDPHAPGREITLAPQEEATITLAFSAHSCPKEQQERCEAVLPLPLAEARQQLDQGFYGFVSDQPQFFCEMSTEATCARLNHLTLSARQDLWPLLIPYKTDNMAEALPVLTAGTPDFRTLFGRDSLIAILLGNLPRQLARNIIRAHSANLNAAGFIPHELNFGPRINETPFNFVTHMLGQACQAYDAQNLYLLALNRQWRESGDAEVILQHWQDIQRIRAWNEREINTHGLIAYTLDCQNTLLDKGWMDGGHAIRWPDGRPFSCYPKATVELQALYYKGLMTEIAWLETAEIAGALAARGVNVAERLLSLRNKASAFQAAFDTLFWDAEQGFYSQAVGWDAARGRWVQNGVLASNIHYLIGSGLVTGPRLDATLRQVTDPAWGLFNPEVGIRTVSACAAFYDPEAYQQGSSWTFDSALAALHLKQQRRQFLRAGDTDGAALCSAALAAYTHALFQVFAADGNHFAEHLHGDSGAELVSGNKPQLWSIAAWLRTENLLMGLEIDARHGEIHLNPSPQLQTFRLLNVPAGMGTVSLRYEADAAQRVQVLENTSGCRIWLHEREATPAAALPETLTWQPEQEAV